MKLEQRKVPKRYHAEPEPNLFSVGVCLTGRFALVVVDEDGAESAPLLVVPGQVMFWPTRKTAMPNDYLFRYRADIPSTFGYLKEGLENEFPETVREGMLRTLYLAVAKAHSYSKDSVQLRIEKLLAEMATHPDAMTAPGGVQIVASRTVMAQYIGCSREMFGRVVNDELKSKYGESFSKPNNKRYFLPYTFKVGHRTDDQYARDFAESTLRGMQGLDSLETKYKLLERASYSPPENSV